VPEIVIGVPAEPETGFRPPMLGVVPPPPPLELPPEHPLNIPMHNNPATINSRFRTDALLTRNASTRLTGF
jgi:hypothetical protein